MWPSKRRLLHVLVFIAWPVFLCAEVAPEAVSKILPVAPAVKEIVKLTEGGFLPATLSLRKLDGSVFFLNATPDSLLTLQVDFRGHKTHCASPNLKIGEDGVIRSVKPIGPKDFALMCFPEIGTYKVTVEGVRGMASPVSGTIAVTE